MDVISTGDGSPFGSFDGNFAWLADEFPATLACSVAYLDVPDRTSNDESMELFGDEEAVRTFCHFSPLQMRYVTERSLDDKTLLLQNGHTTLFPMLNPKDDKIYLAGPRLDLESSTIIPYIFKRKEFSRVWERGTRFYKIVQK